MISWPDLGRRVAALISRLAGGELFRQLVRKVLVSAFIKIAYGIIALILAAFLARMLGPSGYGYYSFAFAVVTLLAIPVQLGLPTLLVRESARYRFQEEWSRLKGILKFANRVTLSVTFCVLLVAGIVYLLYSNRFQSGGLPVLLAALGLLPMIALGNLRGAALRGLGYVIEGQLPEMIFRPALFLILLLVVGSSGLLTATTAMTMHVTAALFSFLMADQLLRKRLPSGVSKAIPFYNNRAWLHSILPLSFIFGMQLANSQVDILVLGFLRTSNEVGVYKAAVTGAIQVPFALSLINAVFAPQFVHLHENGNTQELKTLARQAAGLSFFFSLPLVSSFVFFGKPIISAIFGDSYLSAYEPLVILSIAQLITAAGGSFNIVLTMMKHENDVAVGVSVATITNLLLNFILIPEYGMVGSATATATALILWRLLMLRLVWMRLK
jgi:O-antigen/teichoic acid export membrane protein